MEIIIAMICVFGLVVGSNVHKADLKHEENLKRQVIQLKRQKPKKRVVESQKYIDGVTLANLELK